MELIREIRYIYVIHLEQSGHRHTCESIYVKKFKKKVNI